MRILLVTGSFPPMQCGVGDYSNNLAKALAKDPEVEIGILTSISGVNEGDSNLMEIFPIICGWRILEVLKVVKVIRHWSPDVVHIQYPTQGYGEALLPEFLPIIATLMRRKVVQTWHERYGRRAIPRLLLRLIVPSKLVVVRSQYQEGLGSTMRRLVSKQTFVFIKNSSNFPRIVLDGHKRATVRSGYLCQQSRLIAFLGFVTPDKGIDLLFDVANPTSDQIVIAGKPVVMGKGKITKDGESYLVQIMKRASQYPWQGKVTFAGFLSSPDAAELLAVADAVVLPMRTGGGEWNTSIHAAVLQGTFVVTTSLSRNGYDEKYNIYYARIDDVNEMKSALGVYAGKRRKYNSDIDRDEWRFIADEHRSLYSGVL